jgi:transcriptional regulator with GAF, ATPase, and Fis domain
MEAAIGLSQISLDASDSCLFVVELESGEVVAANARGADETGFDAEELRRRGLAGLLREREQGTKDALGEGWCRATVCRAAWLVRRDRAEVAVSVSAVPFDAAPARYALLVVRADEALAASRPEQPPRERDYFPTIVGESGKIREVCRRIGSLAKSDATVLIQGESGTGKEIVANAVHAHSRRGRGPLIKVNCAALTETLLESELFGHVKGAFTGAIRDRHGRFKQADGGTLFLDEIGSMSLTGQAKLLRVLQEHEFEPVGSSVTVPVNARVIAATNTELAAAVSAGRFREDLYYRLNVFPIQLPPLRDRVDDIPLLAKHFLRQYAAALGKGVPSLTAETARLLTEYAWPGNVRELENAVEHAVIIAEGEAISPESLPLNLSRLGQSGADRDGSAYLRERLIGFEKQMLIEALARAGGVKKRAAAILGVDARNLPYLLRKHHLAEARPSRKS